MQPPGDDEEPELTCRVYRLRDGRISPLPDRDQVREALIASRAGAEDRGRADLGPGGGGGGS